MKKGTLYGVGVGPGDWELMTLKAVRIIKECPVIAVPGEKKEDSTAYRIASGALDLSEKECLEIPMPMTKDEEMLEHCHALGSRRLEAVLASGRDAAFLVLGDPAIYSTYSYLQERIQKDGYKTETVSGVPSFCAAAARLNIPLAEKAEELHVIPASYQMDHALSLPGTKVFMKAGRNMAKIKKKLMDLDAPAFLVENCGMEKESVAYSADGMKEDAGYYSIVLLKER
jgi:precorrin-2/cobalt-factor-2 C20-methyltransferase